MSNYVIKKLPAIQILVKGTEIFMDIISNQYLKVTEQDDGLYLETFKKGYPIQDFIKFVSDNPEIKILSFTAIRNSLVNAPQPVMKFAEMKSKIAVSTADNDMKAYITLHLSENELKEGSQSELVREILLKLRKSGVIFGIKTDAIFNKLISGEPILIAEGIPPVNGTDSVIRMYELKEPKPEIKDDGKADFYELNLINKVFEGAWLGDRTEPTEGVPGKNVKGETVKPISGKRFPLFYDPETVREVFENNVTTLYSKINGAVHYKGDKINVSNYLEITQDVGFNTGNIDFDGFLTVKGAIADNFSVSAKNDVEILGEFGIGSVKEVLSRNGNVCIKGGIAGKNKAVVKSTKDIYTKFVSDATIECSGNVYIGYYCMNSNIKAKQVIIESNKGKILGGVIEAEQKVEAAYVGNAGEKRTQIIVSGFNRNDVKAELEKLQIKLEETKSELAKAKQLFAIFSERLDASSRQFKESEAAKERYFEVKDRVKRLEHEIKSLMKCFKVRGEGEVNITKKVYPNTMVEIKGIIEEIRQESFGNCFVILDNEIRKI
ncbi:MAG TPA: FapA family protein [Clostridia bacterium]|nr:FapA family protein [Clostridia bacterium]